MELLMSDEAACVGVKPAASQKGAACPKDLACLKGIASPCENRSQLKKQSYALRSLVAMFSLTLAIGSLSSACRAPERSIRSDRPVANAVPTALKSQPATVLTLTAIPWKKNGEQQLKLQALAAYLQEKSGISIQIELANSYQDATDLLVEGKVDLAYLGAFSYIKARDRNPQLEPLVAPIGKASGHSWYTSVIVVRSNSGINTLADLKGRRFSFVSPASTSGFLVPSAQLQKLSLNPEQDFGAVEYSGGHHQSAEILAAGKVDAIATDKHIYLKESKPGGLLAAGNYTIIWESAPIPNGPIAISRELPAPLKVALKKAFLDAPPGFMDANGAEVSGYSIAEDSDYDIIRKLKAALNP